MPIDKNVPHAWVGQTALLPLSSKRSKQCGVTLVTADAGRLIYISFMLHEVKSVNNIAVAALDEFDVKFSRSAIE